jgi:Fic family protein
MSIESDYIESLVSEYKSLNLSTVIDFDKFNHYAIVHHSATIEGSTLTEVETRLLLDEGLTPKGKPLLHSLMVQDHFQALTFVLGNAVQKTLVTPGFICEVNSRVIKSTGAVYNTIFGEIDSTKGKFRKGNVSAGSSYFVNFDKVPRLVEKLSHKISETISNGPDMTAQLNLSFDVHFDLVTIHPFYDGNGRTSRLLMNYIQSWFGLPLTIVFKEDRAEYFQALMNTREKEDISIFRQFMYGQTAKYLEAEIKKFKQSNETDKDQRKGGGYSLIF